MAGNKLAVLIVAMMVVATAMSAQAISCSQVISVVSPCMLYLQLGGAPSFACCNGVNMLNNVATTTPDRKTACDCLKSLVGSDSGVKPAVAESLTRKCGVNLPYKISPNADCNSYTYLLTQPQARADS